MLPRALPSHSAACMFLVLSVVGVLVVGAADDPPAPPAWPGSEELAAFVERIHPAVVSIEMVFGRPRMGSGLRPEDDVPQAGATSSAASGVLISASGEVLTNWHVVGEATAIEVGLPDGRIFAGERVGGDPLGDLALVRIRPPGPVPFAPLGDSDRLAVGDLAVAMGNPWNSALTDFRPSVSLGIVSGLHRMDDKGEYIYGDSIQTDAALNPGNSGGPLFNLRGELIGINGKIHVRRGRMNSGIGYAISANQIRNFLPDMRKGGVVRHGTLGAQAEDAFEGRGALLTEVAVGGAAAAAGLQVGDRIVELHGRPVRSAADLRNVLSVFPAGWRVLVRFARGEEAGEQPVTLGVFVPTESPEGPSGGR
ncbi:MAG: trypsin-like peptidase domain-containing protein [Planctomycetes bacterium]|nr:trypsin-like peptidase domain-containing protein [Planctomycetota bacterium]